MILNAKEILKQLYNCCDLIEERLLDGDEKPGCDLRKQLLKDTASFAARVSARKTITEVEASFLNALTGRKDTAEVWRPVCCERESGVPESFWYFVQADKAIMRRHAMSREASMTESLYRYFCAVGDAMVAENLCTKDAARAETERLSACLKTAFDNDPELC